MYEILEMLYDYSVSYRKADREFFERVLSLYWDGLKGYLEHVRYVDIKQKSTDPSVYSSMAYAFYTKEIDIDEKIMEETFVRSMLSFQMMGLDIFDMFLSYNACHLIYLLHEIGHANLYKKAFLNDGSFESELFHLCYYPEIKLSSNSLLKLPVLNSSFIKIFDEIDKVDATFDHSSPDERIVQIDSTKQVFGLLEVFNEDIKKIPQVLEFFRTKTFEQYMVGYDKNNLGDGPLVRYINELKKIDSRKFNKMIANLEGRFGEITTVDDKVKYGLNVSRQEINDLKRRVLK